MTRPPVRRSIVAAACVAATLVQPSLAVASARCLTPVEKTAFEVRMLQTELMVATLTCRGVNSRDFAGQYAIFVNRHREGLKSHSTVFQGHFKRAYGGAGQTQLDRYVTSLANDYSRASMTGTGAFCDQQGDLFDRAATVQPQELQRFASERAQNRAIGVPSCGERKSNEGASKKK
jgi:hypothetical protein